MTGAMIARLGEVAEQRWGMVTTEQAAQIDVSRATLSNLAASGAIIRIGQGVYRMAGAPELPDEQIYATWLGLGGATRAMSDAGVSSVVAAGITAAVLHGIGDFYPERPEFIVPARRATRLYARLRVAALAPEEVGYANGVPTLTIERTIADLVALWTDRSLVADTIADAASQSRLTAPGLVAEYLAPLAAANGYADGATFATDLFTSAGVNLTAHA